MSVSVTDETLRSLIECAAVPATSNRALALGLSEDEVALAPPEDAVALSINETLAGGATN